MKPNYERALIVGAGDGLSASVARLFAAEGMRIGLAARNTEKLNRLASEIQAAVHPCDVSQPDQVDALFSAMSEKLGGAPDVVLFNPSARARGPFAELDRDQVANVLNVTAYGGYLVAQQLVQRALPNRHGAILFTGASASVKGFAKSAPFAMGKFALRGLAQSLARELHPQGIHVAHFVIDGGIGRDSAGDSKLDPDAIAQTYLDILRQDRSVWSWEIELRPWVESF
jgi:NAD(P)-dependent dehydrogenase (short-subunit alcohol dehydrogenase family)